MLKKKKPDNGSKKTSVSEEVNAVFDYIKRQIQKEKSKKDKQAEARQRELNNFENLNVEYSDNELARQLTTLEEAA